MIYAPPWGTPPWPWITPEAGLRRSQSLLGGLRGTEPFHWGGELRTFHLLMDAQSTRLRTSFSFQERSTLFNWLDLLPNPTGMAPSTDEGRAAFESAGCATCHTGASMSDELNHDVGRGEMQTPRLGAVALRAPYFHDGCAAVLEETFDGTCRSVEVHGADPALWLPLADYLRSL